jgi:hypothetical protein
VPSTKEKSFRNRPKPLRRPYVQTRVSQVEFFRAGWVISRCYLSVSDREKFRGIVRSREGEKVQCFWNGERCESHHFLG